LRTVVGLGLGLGLGLRLGLDLVWLVSCYALGNSYGRDANLAALSEELLL